MNAIDWIFIILYYINFAAIILVTLQFIPQGLFYLFFWLPRKHFKPSTNYKKVALIIPAHNEEEVIYHTVRYLYDNLDYPKDKFDVYVCAHNCKDNTASEARRAGATVYEFNDPDKSHGSAGYALNHLISKILEDNVDFDFMVRIDADNILCKTYLKEMNNAINAGAKIVRGYEAASNLRQNMWTEQCAIFYIKDSRVQNTFRQFVNSTSMMPGPGMTFTKEVAIKMNGFDCLTKAEDAEFTFKRLYDGYKIYFNTDAIVYEDQPSSYHDTKLRLTRLGGSLTKLFFTDGWRMIVKFFKTGNPMYLDMLLQIGFNPISVICLTWFPLYYATYAILMLCGMCGAPVFSSQFFTFNLYSLGNLTTLAPTANIIFTDLTGSITGTSNALYSVVLNQVKVFAGGSDLDFRIWASSQAFINLLHMAWQVILMLSVFCIFQSFVALMMDHKKLGLSWKLEGVKKGILLSPIFSLVYGVCNVLGVFLGDKWIVAKRNLKHQEILLPREEPINSNKRIRYFTLSEKEIKKYHGK